MKYILCVLLAVAVLSGCINEAEPTDTQMEIEIEPSPESTPSSDTDSLIALLRQLMDGQGNPEAAEYDPDDNSIHRFGILDVDGNPHPWNSELPSDWLPLSINETELVVVVIHREVPRGSQSYMGGPAITRYQNEMDVKIIEARTGKILVDKTIRGTYPGPFPETAPKEQTRITGSEIRYEDFEKEFLGQNGLNLGLGIQSQCWPTEYNEKLMTGALSTEGNILVSGGYYDNNEVELWDVENGTLLFSLFGETDSKVSGITLSHDNQNVAVGYSDGSINVWQVLDGSLLHEMKGPAERVSQLIFSPDDQILASAGSDVHLWDMNNGERIKFLGIEGFVFSLAFSPDGQTLAIGRGDNSVTLWGVSREEIIGTLSGNTYGTTSLAFSHDGTRLAGASVEDGVVCVWDTSDGSLVQTLDGLVGIEDGLLTEICLSPEGQLLAAGSLGEINLFQVSDGSLIDTLSKHTGNVTNLEFSSNGRTLLSGSNDGICTWMLEGIMDLIDPANVY